MQKCLKSNTILKYESGNEGEEAKRDEEALISQWEVVPWEYVPVMTIPAVRMKDVSIFLL